MALHETPIALASVISSAVVATAGVLVPVLVNLSNRRHDLKLRIIDNKKEAYRLLSHLMFLVNTGDEVRATKIADENAGYISLWSSDEVEKQFESWIEAGGLDPNSKKSIEQKALRASIHKKLRKQMSDEVLILK